MFQMISCHGQLAYTTQYTQPVEQSVGKIWNIEICKKTCIDINELKWRK